MITVAVAALTLLSGGPASGTSTTIDAAAVVQQAARADAATRICVRSLDPTGTILTRSVCRTRAEWDRAGGLPSRDKR